MDRQKGQSIKRLLVLKRIKLEVEAGRLQNGIAAGSELRDRLMTAESSAAYVDLTTPHVLRTVGILDRGLAVLSQQHSELMARHNQVERALEIVGERVAETAEEQERKEAELLISESIAAGVKRKSS